MSGPISPSSLSASKSANHRINAAGSVQALVIDEDVIFGGLQGGYIVAWSLETYECLTRVYGHHGSVLGLSLSDDRTLLFSTGADSIINVWSTRNLRRLHCINSYYEVGDIFCVVYSAEKQVIFCGSQNASIQWHTLDSTNSSTASQPDSTDTLKSQQSESKHDLHRAFGRIDFFNSARPDEIPDISSEELEASLQNLGGRNVITDSRHYAPYAHKSYIYSLILAQGLLQDDPKGERLVSAGGDGTIKVWGLQYLSKKSLVQLLKFKNPELNVLSLAYEGFFLYAGLSNGFAHIYNLESQQLIQKLQVGHGDINQIQAFNGSLLCGTSEGWVKNFNSHFTEVEEWRAHDGKILATGWTSKSSSRILITGGNDNRIGIWSLKNGVDVTTAAAAHSNDELINALRDFVSYRSVALNPKCVTDCQLAVNFLRKRCNAFGGTTTLLSPKDGVNPILLAKFQASSNFKNPKSVLFYGHYDVVDAEVQTEKSNVSWQTEPFTLHPLNGFLYGRGVTDNKGPILAAVYAVADLTHQDALSCNVIFLLEGDEEAGSRGFRKTVQDHREEIGDIDNILLSNSYWLDDHIPCLTFGMRGVVHATITINSNKPELHSGVDGKSIQHEPLKDLTALIGTLIGQKGLKIMIPGFIDTVDKVDRAELEAYRVITSALLPGHPEIKDEKTFAMSLMQRWRYPNLTVHRIEVPETKTAVTIAGSTKAVLSIRIVPSQTAEEVASSLTTFLTTQFTKFQSSNRLKVDITAKADPWLGDIKSNLYEELSQAITEVWSVDTNAANHRTFPISKEESEAGSNPVQKRSSHRRASSLANLGTFTLDNVPREPLFIREGGSIPAITFLENEFNAPAAMFPMGQASDNAHLDNERMRVENLYKGRDVLKKVFSRL